MIVNTCSSAYKGFFFFPKEKVLPIYSSALGPLICMLEEARWKGLLMAKGQQKNIYSHRIILAPDLKP